MRLDKLLANMDIGSRKHVRALIKKSRVTINGLVNRDNSIHVDTNIDIVRVDDEVVHYQRFIYIMMNKSAGYISATEDAREKTVIDLLASDIKHYNPFPVGRLDKDTEGLLLLTNDGELTHELTSPKKDIEKTYFAKVEGVVTDEDIKTLLHGVRLDDGHFTKPAELVILRSDTLSEVELTITEGKYHQVKRMFGALGKRVVYLKRIRMGKLLLDETIPLGSYRELHADELAYCLSLK